WHLLYRRWGENGVQLFNFFVWGGDAKARGSKLDGFMIFFLFTQRNLFSFKSWLRTWGSAVSGRGPVLLFVKLTPFCSAVPGTYIFSDLELLTPWQKGMATELWDRLAVAGGRVKLLNHPRRSLMRYELLKALRERGRLAYDAYRATELPAELKFPVFLRMEND